MAIATLIAAGRLDDRLIDRALGLLRELDPKAAFLHWIDEGDAADLQFCGTAKGARWALDGLEGVDIAVQPEEPRWKRLLVADMDSTIIDQECIDELADEVGIKAEVAAITARSMNGEIAFEPALRERVALLKGLQMSVITNIIERRITLAAGAVELVRTMRSHGAWTALVSGGFDVFTGPIAAKIGFNEQRANRLVEAGGRLAGAIAEPILGRAAKADALTQIATRLGMTAADAMAVGDGANDLDMLQLAGTGVALHAKPVVAAAAKVRIDHGDLTSLLYIQGYSHQEFAA